MYRTAMKMKTSENLKIKFLEKNERQSTLHFTVVPYVKIVSDKSNFIIPNRISALTYSAHDTGFNVLWIKNWLSQLSEIN